MSNAQATVTPAVRVVATDAPSLGDRSYLVSDVEVAVIVDPQRDIDRVLDRARHLGMRITYVAETHLHNDYLPSSASTNVRSGPSTTNG